MSKCRRCKRELKNHTETGMGKICQMKANMNSETGKTGIRIVPLYVGHPARRSYVAFGQTRRIVVIAEDRSGRFADCPCSGEICEHVAAVAEFDRARFPENIYPETATASHLSGLEVFAGSPLAAA